MSNEENNQEKMMHDIMDSYIIELNIDAVGLWEIIRDGRQLNLDKTNLSKFVLDIIIHLLQHGAIPAISIYGHGWQSIDRDLSDSHLAATQIISEWLEKQSDPQPYDSIWFVRPVLLTKDEKQV